MSNGSPERVRIDLRGVSRVRNRAAAVEREIREKTNALSDTRVEVARLAAVDPGNAGLGRGRARADQLREELNRLLIDRDKLRNELLVVSDDIVSSLDPANLIKSLDGETPVALLPVRLETRFVDGELRIRIFPDQIHLDAHEPELTDAEMEAGRAYWNAVWAATSEGRADGGIEEAWAALATGKSPRRARWLVDQLRPLNADRQGVAGTTPEFPEPDRKAEDWTKAVEATALPDRWVAIGFRGDTTVFRVWGTPVPDRLATTPTPDPAVESEGTVDLVPERPPGDDPMQWLVDYGSALEVGMAITVRQQDLSGGSRLMDGLDRLVVLGVDWTLKPEEASGRLEALIEAHRFTDGCVFQDTGTPSNNTGSVRSGTSTALEATASEMSPASTPAEKLSGTAGPLLTEALGLPDGALDTLSGAAGTEASTAELLQRAIWLPTIGHYLDDLLDPIVSDTDVEFTRDHVASWLRPSGPLAPLRIGKQPYGVLPVVPFATYRPDRTDGFEAKLHHILSRFRPLWSAASLRQPWMGKGSDPDLDLLALEQRNPLSVTARFRQALGPSRVNTTGHESLADAQGMAWGIWRLILGWKPTKTPVIAQHTVLKQSHYLGMPWVQAELDAAAARTSLSPNYLAAIAALARQRTGRETLNSQVNGGSLLEVFAAHAALLELDLAASKLVGIFIGAQDIATRLTKSLRTSDLYGVVAEPADTVTPRLDQPGVTVTTPLQQANLVIQSVTGTLTVSEHVSDLLVRLPERPEVHQLADFVDAMEQLATRPASEVERAFRGFMDATSHRLDAWITSIATRRLASLRARKKTGIHIGGYGWVENLRPSPDPDSLGYVHAPSLQHAAAAAILRSGHLSHHGDDHEALDIQLTSDRVQRAIPILEGVAGGQQLGALLGYRFERSLRETDLRLMQHVPAFRALAPIRTSSAATGVSTEAQETIATHDVVDGVRLLEIWRDDPARVRGTIEGTFPKSLGEVLDDLETSYDAVGDLLMAEAVYQTTLGNYERAGAALAAMDKQERSPQPEIIRTPRSGHGYTQKVLVVLGGRIPEAWRSLRDDPRGMAAAAINAWAARLLPDPVTVLFAGRLISVNQAGDETVKGLSASLTDLGISPASLIWAGTTPGPDQPSELETRIAAALVDGVDTGPDDRLEILDDPPDGDASTVGLGALRALLDWMRSLVMEARPAIAEDLSLPGGDRSSGIDMSALAAVADEAEAALRDAADGLTNAVGGPSAQLRNALLGVSAFGIATAVPRPGSGNGAELQAALTAQAEQVLIEVDRRLSALEFTPAPTGLEGQPPTERDLVEHQRTRLQTTFGPGFPVMPEFMPTAEEASAAMLVASLADRESLTGSDPSLVRSWIDRMGLVRPGVDRLSRVLVGSEMLGGFDSAGPESAIVAQLPHVQGQRWLALAFDDGPADAHLALVMHASDGFDPTQTISALVVDEWNERIPLETETTGITFHYDAPGARAPQSVLLAVAPEIGRAAWDLDTLIASVLEAADLGRIRGVAPKDLEGVGHALPMVYLPDNFTKDRPSVDMFGLAAEWRKSVKYLSVVGKGVSL